MAATQKLPHFLSFSEVPYLTLSDLKATYGHAMENLEKLEVKEVMDNIGIVMTLDDIRKCGGYFPELFTGTIRIAKNEFYGDSSGSLSIHNDVLLSEYEKYQNKP